MRCGLGTGRGVVGDVCADGEHVLGIDGATAVDVVTSVGAVNGFADVGSDGEHVLGVNRPVAIGIARQDAQAYSAQPGERTSRLQYHRGFMVTA